MTTPQRVWIAIACTDPEHNGPDECFREVIGGTVYTHRDDAIKAAEATGLPFFEDMPDAAALAGQQWCTIDSYRVRKRARGRKEAAE